MKTCEFCMFAGDECYLLHEPIEYDSSGMTIKENCPIRHDNLQIPVNKRQMVRSKDKSDR